MTPQDDALRLIPETMAFVYKVMPLSLQDGVLTVAVAPEDLPGLEDLRNFLDVREIKSVASSRADIEAAIATAYGTDDHE